MTNKKHKPGIQTNLDDMIMYAENDQTFALAIQNDLSAEEAKKKIGLKELSIQLKNPAFCKTILKKP